MRELNECKAEIFQRSKKRILARRRARNRLLALCIPICSVILILSVAVLPEKLSNKTGGSALNNASDGGLGNVSGIYPEMSDVEIYGGSGDNLSSQNMDFDVQYIRTDMQNYSGNFPSTAVIHSVSELTEYYEANKEMFHLERRKDPSSDSTIGFLDACDKYDTTFFENHALVMIVLEESSGSIRHNVNSIEVDANNIMYVNIDSIDPDIGTCDMAYWHIITEVPKNKAPHHAENIVVYYNSIKISNVGFIYGGRQ